ncbi:hypothetical protein PR048_004153 [Dryococelus australis]|uniref:Uncharacterized protein n=1 Tax=Dryococelus australis TaxID=614101 RepID=A0ABQ9I5R1_9NEOP|nr:hypothetical protein PR048_004153 [Dryococelus australis]
MDYRDVEVLENIRLNSNRHGSDGRSSLKFTSFYEMATYEFQIIHPVTTEELKLFEMHFLPSHQPNSKQSERRNEVTTKRSVLLAKAQGSTNVQPDMRKRLIASMHKANEKACSEQQQVSERRAWLYRKIIRNLSCCFQRRCTWALIEPFPAPPRTSKGETTKRCADLNEEGGGGRELAARPATDNATLHTGRAISRGPLIAGRRGLTTRQLNSTHCNKYRPHPSTSTPFTSPPVPRIDNSN